MAHAFLSFPLTNSHTITLLTPFILGITLSFYLAPTRTTPDVTPDVLHYSSAPRILQVTSITERSTLIGIYLVIIIFPSIADCHDCHILLGTVEGTSLTKATTLTLLDGSQIMIDSTAKVSKKAPTNSLPPTYSAVQADGADGEVIATEAVDEVSREGVAGLQRLMAANM